MITAHPVTPLAGVWIEIESGSVPSGSVMVTPLAGVWIEISITDSFDMEIPSLPLRECGLKLCTYILW